MATTTVISPVESCKVMQAYLATANQPGTGALNLGFHEALLNPENRAGLVGVNISGDGKPISGSSCRLILKYIKPDCSDTTNDTTLCDISPAAGSNPFGSAEFQFQTADIISAPYKLTKEQFDCSCDPMDRQMGELLNQKMRNIFRNAEKRLLENAWNCLGAYCDGTESTVSPATLNIFNEDGNAAQPLGWWFVQEQLDAMKATGKPIVVGGTAIRKYLWAQKVAGIGANGVGATGTVDSDFQFYYSSEFDSWARNKTGVNGDYAIVFAPGTFQLIDWQYNVGANVENIDIKSSVTMQFMNNGFDYLVDYSNYYDAKCREWEILPTRTSGVFCMPEDDLCDDIVGNWRFLVKLGCGSVDCGPLCGSESAS